MKKVMLLFFVCALGLGASAQTEKMDNMDQSGKSMKMKDCVMMKGGEMMVMKGGEKMKMDKDMTMHNGTMVMTDGTVKMKSGKTMMMKDGDCMYMDGKMSKMKMSKSMNMDKKM
jgi:hypothetical protein